MALASALLKVTAPSSVSFLASSIASSPGSWARAGERTSAPNTIAQMAALACIFMCNSLDSTGPSRLNAFLFRSLAEGVGLGKASTLRSRAGSLAIAGGLCFPGTSVLLGQSIARWQREGASLSAEGNGAAPGCAVHVEEVVKSYGAA